MSRPAVGRLAPTPSGYLHLGNARSFLLAWLWARAHGGRVVMRIEDIDLPRCKPEYTEAALNELAWLGLTWEKTGAGSSSRSERTAANASRWRGGDGLSREFTQSARIQSYREALQTLIQSGHAYPCTCTRKDIEQASSAPHGDEGAIYPGTCRGRWKNFEHAKRETGVTPAWRFLFEGSFSFHDEVQGYAAIDAATLGDFVLWRRDDLPSYQFAVTVDDAEQGITQVLRGRDLVSSTARQLALYAALNLPPPDQWAHVPFIQDAQGRRMAKRDGDLALAHMRETGVDPRRIIGLLAWSAGLIAEAMPLAARELVGAFDVHAIGRADFVVTPEHLAWLGNERDA